MKNALTITGLSREALTEAGVIRPVVSLDSVKLDARHSGAAQIIGHVGTGRVLVVFPGGGVIGASGEPLFLDEAIAIGEGRGAVNVRMDEEVGK